MQLRALKSISVYTAMTGALDHQEEGVFMSEVEEGPVQNAGG